VTGSRCWSRLPAARRKTVEEAHAVIRSNLHRAPMFSGQIASVGPRYCPSIEDKVVRFAERQSHGVFLEPEGLDTDWVYCNGIATSLPADVQDETRPDGCPGASAPGSCGTGTRWSTTPSCRTRSMRRGTPGRSGGCSSPDRSTARAATRRRRPRGLVAGLNAGLLASGRERVVFGRDEAYLGVLMDDLVTKTPVEPYRMFTSRAEHRLMLRSDNASDRLTPLAARLGLLGGHGLGSQRLERFRERERALTAGRAAMAVTRDGEKLLKARCREPVYEAEDLAASLAGVGCDLVAPVVRTLHAEARYEPYIERERTEIRRRAEHDRKRLPDRVDYTALADLRTEARQALSKFRPETYGQASRLEGITPADLTLLRVLVERSRRERGADAAIGAEAPG
jgi:tRNA uridine 5-carboxymethylaminomethyl modification enzyme